MNLTHKDQISEAEALALWNLYLALSWNPVIDPKPGTLPRPHNPSDLWPAVQGARKQGDY